MRFSPNINFTFAGEILQVQDLNDHFHCRKVFCENIYDWVKNVIIASTACTALVNRTELLLSFFFWILSTDVMIICSVHAIMYTFRPEISARWVT